MENASKALIIAGAILLSILIIGLGMYIYQQAEGLVQNNGLDSQKVKTYNQTYVNYSGTQNGTQVRKLCEEIVSHNITASDSSEFIIVQSSDATAVTSNGTDDKDTYATINSNINTIKKTIKSARMYEVTLGYDAKTGYVCAVGIVEQ